jgi:hypothetical protein
MAGLIGLSRKGYFKKGENVLFVHTGGSLGLYAYIKPVLELEKVADLPAPYLTMPHAPCHGGMGAWGMGHGGMGHGAWGLE